MFPHARPLHGEERKGGGCASAALRALLGRAATGNSRWRCVRALVVVDELERAFAQHQDRDVRRRADAGALRVNAELNPGQKIFDAVKEGTITTVSYNFPNPTLRIPCQRNPVRDEACGVGYYK